MTEYLYASPSEKAAFAGAPDDATHAIKLDGQKRWAKKNEADEMMFYAVKGNDIVWRTMELHECEEYELVAERAPIPQSTTRRPAEGSELKWEDAPDGAEFKLKNRTNGSLAWGKNESDDYIAVALQHSDGWYSFTINDWEIISRRVPVTIGNIPDALPGSAVMTGDAIGSTFSMAGNWHDLGQFPPAGIKAEARRTDGTWEQCLVIGMNNQGQCIVETDWDCELRKVVRAIDFRPFDAKRQKLLEDTRELIATRSMNDAQKAQAIHELYTSQQ